MAFVQMPQSGVGFWSYSEPHKRWGEPWVIAAIARACLEMYARHGIEIGVGNISLEHGGPMPPHKTHQTGDRVDFLPIRLDRKRENCRWDEPGYDRDKTFLFMVELFKSSAKRLVFNDKVLYMPGRISLAGHDNHIHAVF